MKKSLKNIIVTGIALIFLYLLINVSLFLVTCNKNNVHISENIGNLFKREQFSIEKCIKNQNVGAVSGENYKKNGIIIFGCGFASGLFLQEHQKFNAKLSEYLKRPVYNYGIGGGYIQHSIILVQSGIIDDIIKNSDYVINIISGLGDGPRLEVFPGGFFDYFLIDNQIYPVFKPVKNNDLKQEQKRFLFFSDSILFRVIHKFYVENFRKKEDYLKNTYIHLLKLQKELKKKNPNIKLILFLYFSPENEFAEYADLLKKEGIEIFSLRDSTKDDLVGSKYAQSPQNVHPSENAWNLITPLFAEKMGL